MPDSALLIVANMHPKKIIPKLNFVYFFTMLLFIFDSSYLISAFIMIQIKNWINFSIKTNASTDGRNVVASGNTLDVVIKVETVRIRVLNSVN